ncbi:hypothetical protein E4U26_005574 [Claviceps purpurea]|nr:hypothetical protein E4U51_006233 [Claviceps purpurea]KAG6163749.1 hypothetical protein E4U11_001694 [Claviceps purpurea]KAG6232272.1 hypothetical protein E4U26_005574 [Claviceps purpurea]
MSNLLSAGQLPRNRHDDLENYGIDPFDDPFATPSPPSSPKKRKELASQGLGIDQEVSVPKRAREPRVKLDESRLLGPSGLPKLRKRARDLNLKGKGHEFSDAARLLSFYQIWLDDLFPKAKFLDALTMVEKLGHKKQIVVARNEILNEGKPKAKEDQDDDFGMDLDAPAAVAGVSGSGAAPSTARAVQGGDRPVTPVRDEDVPDEEDLYGATPRVVRQQNPPRSDIPDEEDLYGATPRIVRQQQPRSDIPDEEDLYGATPRIVRQKPQTSDILDDEDLYGATPRIVRHRAPQPDVPDEEDDLDALIAEAESQDRVSSSIVRAKAPLPATQQDDADGEDDLDALIAEAETRDSEVSLQKPSQGAPYNGGETGHDFDEEEAAMQGMDGW